MKFLRILFFLFFYNVMGSFHFKKILGMPKNYLVNLKKDMQQMNLTKSSIKNFARLHPFISAKLVHESLLFFVYVLSPAVYCGNQNCKKSFYQHFVLQGEHYYYRIYNDFYHFNFVKEPKEFLKNYFVKFFYHDFYFEKLIFFLFFPFCSIFSLNSFERQKEIFKLKIKSDEVLVHKLYENCFKLLQEDIKENYTIKNPENSDGPSHIYESENRSSEEIKTKYLNTFIHNFQNELKNKNLFLNCHEGIIDYYKVYLEKNFDQIYEDAVFKDFFKIY